MKKATFLMAGRMAALLLLFGAVLTGCGGGGGVTVAKASSPDLSIKFGITTKGITTTAEVTETFTAVHNYLDKNKPKVKATTPKGNSFMPAGLATKIGDIKVGDYIDLAGLSIAGYPADAVAKDRDGNDGNGKLTGATNRDIPGEGDRGKLLRLIVVGINTFNANGAYSGNGNGATTHLVFQFQNIPVKHRMNARNTNAGGYAASQMREYLVPVDGKTGSGSFLTGLMDAGVPAAYLWAPKRIVATGGNQNGVTGGVIEDILWLPTEWEIRGSNYGSSKALETEENQASLMYDYDSVTPRKFTVDGEEIAYRLASPSSDDSDTFRDYFEDGGMTDGYPGYQASFAIGCAPAFCVW